MAQDATQRGLEKECGRRGRQAVAARSLSFSDSKPDTRPGSNERSLSIIQSPSPPFPSGNTPYDVLNEWSTSLLSYLQGQGAQYHKRELSLMLDSPVLRCTDIYCDHFIRRS